MTTTSGQQTVRNLLPGRLDAAGTLSVLRSFAGLVSWASPTLTWRTFGLGPIEGSASSGLVTRLFGVRDLLLALALRHPSPELRRAALQIGVAADTAHIVATLLAIRAGAPKSVLLGVSAGAAVFVGLGVAALNQGPPAPIA